MMACSGSPERDHVLFSLLAALLATGTPRKVSETLLASLESASRDPLKAFRRGEPVAAFRFAAGRSFTPTLEHARLLQELLQARVWTRGCVERDLECRPVQIEAVVLMPHPCADGPGFPATATRGKASTRPSSAEWLRR
jgi:hypothetical protein